MDAVNVMKGYDKVNHREINSPPSQQHKRIKAAATISAVLLLALIIALVLIHERQRQRQHQELDAGESIKTVCSVSQNPESCFAALSSSLNISTTTKPDPEVILKLSLQVNVDEISNIITSLKKSLNDGNPHEVALRDCVDQLREALSGLNDSLSEVETLTDRKINDIQTWVSAAMTDEETCLDGLEEMGSTAADQVKSMMKKSTEMLSYSLAIIANIQNLLRKFGLTMH